MFGALLVLPAGVLRIASRPVHADYLMWAWGLQGAALAFIVLGILIGAVKKRKPSPGVWGVLAVWILAAGHGLSYG
ncbi:hypothetical protein [Streptomyces sp. RKAG293]|uniref:hypothetical protein n=1 Tax=Streptomyces sp. RKAG293 TaxID=2893403 RepID=UPI002033F24E|nr:hypothetical protein [Streptomyces sp. RKAG293]MCM2420230.1 hypothetical protein [Streptomyces sp. RKAG293]